MAIPPRRSPPRTTPSPAVSGPISTSRSPTPSTERRTKTAPALRLIGIAAMKICAGCPSRHDGTNNRDHQGGTAFRPRGKRADLQNDADGKSGSRYAPGAGLTEFHCRSAPRHRTSGDAIIMESAMNRHPARETGGSARDGSRRAETAKLARLTTARRAGFIPARALCFY
jgi:hypothetical protein